LIEQIKLNQTIEGELDYENTDNLLSAVSQFVTSVGGANLIDDLPQSEADQK